MQRPSRIMFPPYQSALVAIALGLLLAASAPQAKAETQILTATKDAYISEENPDLDASTLDLVGDTFPTCEIPGGECDRDGDGYVRCAPLVRFDLSAIPSGSTITSCRLYLECWEFQGIRGRPPGSPISLRAFRVTSAWLEWVCWNTKPDWSETLAPEVTFDSTGPVVMDHPELAQIVQMWVDGTAYNYGLLLWPGDDGYGYLLEFYSRETAPSEEAKPRLEITYTPPPPPPPPLMSPPQVLLELHPNERAPGPDPVPALEPGDEDYDQWPPAAGGGFYTWKKYKFWGSGNLWIQVCAQTFSAYQNKQMTGVGDDDELWMYVDGQTLTDFWGIQSGPPGAQQWKGNAPTGFGGNGKRETLEFFFQGSPGLHTIKFRADEGPTLWWVKVYDLELRSTE